MYPVGGGRESVWQPGMPVYIGDRLVLRLFASTGNAQLKEMRVRIDNEPARTLTAAPWVAEIDTTNWKPGYHFVEVFASSTDPNATPGSATQVFYVREPLPPATAAAPPAPTTETTVTAGATQETTTVPQTAVAGSRETPADVMQPPAHPGNAVTMQNGVPLYRAGLDITLRSSDTAVEKALRSGQTVQVARPTLFRVTAGPNARRFLYALTRDGKEIYRSPEPLPLSAMVRLQPKVGTEGVGLLPGAVVLWVWAGDQNNNYGAPAMTQAEIVAQP